jgi:hypothetical protein
MNKLKSAIKDLYGSHPLIIIIGVFILLWLIAVIVMKKATQAAKLASAKQNHPDVMTLSYLGQSSYPRGIRNNNPGNLVKTSIPWQGKKSPSSDSRFEQFTAFVWGLRAQIRDVRGDITNKGQNTIRKLITAYAPAFENNTSGYINQVTNGMNMNADTLLTGSKEEIRKLLKIINRVENGNPQSYIGRTEWFDDTTFDVAWDLAY